MGSISINLETWLRDARLLVPTTILSTKHTVDPPMKRDMLVTWAISSLQRMVPLSTNPKILSSLSMDNTLFLVDLASATRELTILGKVDMSSRKLLEMLAEELHVVLLEP